MGYWFFGSCAMRELGGKSWDAWRRALLAAVLDHQCEDGASHGSWDPVGPWSWSGGRVYATAMCALALESWWRLERLTVPK